uniref:Uncharacterized protein n=1 Tax=Rhizophora mucronata TaxID=61149 RepID=A0A2P2PXG1_RHIMU
MLRSTSLGSGQKVLLGTSFSIFMLSVAMWIMRKRCLIGLKI